MKRLSPFDEWLEATYFWLGWISGQDDKTLPYPIRPSRDLVFSLWSWNGTRISVRFKDGHPLHDITLIVAGQDPLEFRLGSDLTDAEIESAQGAVFAKYPGIQIARKFDHCDLSLSRWCRMGKKTFVYQEGDYWTCEGCQKAHKEKERDRSGYVYLIGNRAHGFYKIGMSKNPAKRLNAIKGILPPFEVGLVWQSHVDDMVKEEKRLHNRFKRYRTNGEWFQIPDEQIADLVPPLESAENPVMSPLPFLFL